MKMSTTAYVQIIPKYNRAGQLVGIRAVGLQKSPPGETDGAFLLRLDIAVPTEAFTPTRVAIDVPIERLAPKVEATLS